MSHIQVCVGMMGVCVLRCSRGVLYRGASVCMQEKHVEASYLLFLCVMAALWMGECGHVSIGSV